MRWWPWNRALAGLRDHGQRAAVHSHGAREGDLARRGGDELDDVLPGLELPADAEPRDAEGGGAGVGIRRSDDPADAGPLGDRERGWFVAVIVLRHADLLDRSV